MKRYLLIAMLITTTAVLLMTSSCSNSGFSTSGFNCASMSFITVNTTIGPGSYNVTCNVEVTAGATLTIAPGTTLLFSQDAGLTVDAGAALNAAGTAGQPIIFNGMQSVPGYWRGILISSISPNNIFSNCTISNAGSSPYTGSQFAANVTLSHASAGFSNCTVSGSRAAGICATSASPDSTYFNSFTNNQVQQNGSYPVVIYSAGAGTLGSSNTFSGNGNNYVGILASEVTVPVTLSAQSVPYLFMQTGTDAGVIFDKALTIAPGTSLAMGSGISLLCKPTGSINAVGTVSGPITIAGLQTTPGYWGSVIVNSNSNLNNFQYCSFSDGGGSPADPISPGESGKGMLSTYMQSPVARSINVTNCSFTTSASSGIYVAAADGNPAPVYNSSTITSANTFSGCSPDVLQ